METEFLKRFSKDLDNLKSQAVKKAILRQIELLESVDSLQEIPNLKKLRGLDPLIESGLVTIEWGSSSSILAYYWRACCIGKIFTSNSHNNLPWLMVFVQSVAS